MRNLVILFLLFTTASLHAQKYAFTVVPLGVRGGGDESNLSSYAVAAYNTDAYVCLDAGTIYSGIRVALDKKSLKGTQEEILKDKIKGYLISHPHLDHISGLLLNASEDISKPIYGTTYTLDVMAEKYFSWKAWANWSDKGEAPQLKKYAMTALEPGKATPLQNTTLSVQAFILSHTSNSQSTAFLLKNNEAYLLYLGDTGPDETEKSTHLKELWAVAAPLIREKKLKAIFIETSYGNVQPDKQLFGHFTPGWLMKELGNLETATGKNALVDFPIVITHMKPTADKEEVIKKELQQLNALQVKLIFAEQGKALEF